MTLLDWVLCDFETTQEFDAVQVSSAGAVDFRTTNLFAGRAAIRVVGGGATPESQADVIFASRNSLTARWLVHMDEYGINNNGFGLIVVGDALGTSEQVVVEKSVDGSVEFSRGSVAHLFDGAGAGAVAYYVTLSVQDGSPSILTVRRADTGEVKTGVDVGTGDGPWVRARIQSNASSRPMVVNQIILDGAYDADLGPHLFGQHAPPTAETATINWTPSAGTDNAALVDERVSDADAEYVSRGDGTFDDVYETDDPLVPLDGAVASPVLGIAAYLTARDEGVVGSDEVRADVLDGADVQVAGGSNVNPGTNYSLLRANARDTTARSRADVAAYRVRLHRQNAGLTRTVIRVTQVGLTYVLDTSSDNADSAVALEDAGSRSAEPPAVTAAGADRSDVARDVVPVTASGSEDVTTRSFDELEAAGGTTANVDLDRGTALDTAAGDDPATGSERAAEGDDAAGTEDLSARAVGEFDVGDADEVAVDRSVYEVDNSTGSEPSARVALAALDEAAGATRNDALVRLAGIPDTAIGFELKEHLFAFAAGTAHGIILEVDLSETVVVEVGAPMQVVVDPGASVEVGAPIEVAVGDETEVET